MPDVINRTTKVFLRSRNNPLFPLAQWIHSPMIAGGPFRDSSVPTKHVNIVGDVLTEMSVAEKAVVGAAEAAEALTAERETEKGEITAKMALRAMGEIFVDEFNRHSLTTNAILDASDGASDMAQFKASIAAISDRPPRDIAVLKTQMRAVIDRLGSL